MSRGTKKVGTTGRYGARYGVKGRRQNASIEVKQRLRHPCPSCSAPSVGRISTGIWRCRRCDYTFAGGAYHPVVTHRASGLSAGNDPDFTMAVSAQVLETLASEAAAKDVQEVEDVSAGGLAGRAADVILTRRPRSAFEAEREADAEEAAKVAAAEKLAEAEAAAANPEAAEADEDAADEDADDKDE